MTTSLHHQLPSAPMRTSRDFQSARAVIKSHCDPKSGTPFWIERARERGIDTERHLQDWGDLHLFGWMDEAALRCRSAFDFVPKALLAAKDALIPAETSGFTGTPKSTFFTHDDFKAAFIHPFEPAAQLAGFPMDGLWLFLGPSGPHPIGRAAAQLGRLHGLAEPFSVDFDPRWFNRLAPNSLARDRYMKHLFEQAISIIGREPVDVLFATPAVLEKLADMMTETQRSRVRGIHYGGQPLGVDRFRRLKDELFPGAVHLGGYGNSLLGVCMEIKDPASPSPSYFPFGSRIRIRVLADEEVEKPEPDRHAREVAYGERGRVVVDRFDRSMLILNMIERDEAIRIPPIAGAASLGYHWDGLAQPDLAQKLKITRAEGIY